METNYIFVPYNDIDAIAGIFPALNIATEEVEEGLQILRNAIDHVVTK